MAYSVFQLPYRLIGDDSDPIRAQKNFEAIAGAIAQVQLYENATGIAVNQLLNNTVADERLGAQIAGFKRVGVAHKFDGAQVATHLPRYETGKFNQALMIEEGTTSQFTSTESQGTFPSFDSYTKLLLHMDGTDASTTFTDEVGKTFTANGNAQIDTAQSKFGGASGLFDGTGDYIDTPDHADFDVGSGDFTVDCWVKRNTTGTVQYICGQSDSGANATSISFLLGFLADNTVRGLIGSGGTLYVAVSSGTVADSNWHHIEFCRDGNTLRLFIDGVADGTGNVTGITANNSANRFAVGQGGEITSNTFNGWIDEFRFSKGIARHTANFTVPTSAYALYTTKSLAAGTYTVAVNAGSGSIALSGGPTGIATLGSPVTFTLGALTNVTFTMSGTVTRCQLEQKAYPTSWQIGGTARAVENITLPTSSIFTKSSWAVELTYIPKDNDTASKKGVLWSCYIDANNYYELRKDITTGYLSLHVVSGGTDKSIVGSSALVVDSSYTIMASGNGTNMRLCVNGAQIGSDTAYTEPVGTLPGLMYLGSNSAGASQCNGLIDDLRFSSRDRTLREHYDGHVSGLPLAVDDVTTLKMDFDSTLRQTTRRHIAREQGTFMVADASTTLDPTKATHIVPPGWTSAQTTFLQAISELPATGGKIVPMDGTFTIDGSILPSSNISLEGQGANTIIKIKNGVNADFIMIINSDTTNGNTGIAISNLTLDGNKNNNTSGDQNGIYVTKISSSNILSCRIINFRNQGIRLNSSNNNVIANNICQNNWGYGVYLYSSSNNTVVGNVLKNNNKGGIYLNFADKNTVTGNTSSENLTAYGGGILLASSSGNIVSSNVCQQNGWFGIYLNLCSDNILSSNVCSENSQETNNTYDNIHLTLDSNYNSIQNNTCRKGSLTNTPRYGIRVNSSDCDGNVVTNNDLYLSGTTGSFSDAGTGTVTTSGNRL